MKWNTDVANQHKRYDASMRSGGGGNHLSPVAGIKITLDNPGKQQLPSCGAEQPRTPQLHSSPGARK